VRLPSLTCLLEYESLLFIPVKSFIVFRLPVIWGSDLQWLCGLRRGSAGSLLGLQVRIPLAAWMSLRVEYGQAEVSASGRSLLQRSPTERGASDCYREISKMRSVPMLCSNFVLQCCVRMLCSNVVFQCFVPILCCNVVLQCCVPILCSSVVFQCCIAMTCVYKTFFSKSLKFKLLILFAELFHVQARPVVPRLSLQIPGMHVFVARDQIIHISTNCKPKCN
jgi:hypothetical protein